MVPEEKIIDFDECPITLNSCTLIIGMKKSGKTKLLRAMIDKLKSNYDDEIMGIWVYSKTGSINKDYDFTKNVSKIDPVDVKRHLIKQEQLKILSERDERVKCKNVILILDDFISDIPHSSAREARVLDTLASMGRHFNITLFILSQRYSKISTTVRDNSDYICCTKISQESLFNLFSLQSDYYSKQELWRDYNEFRKENKHSFMLMQTENPDEPNVLFVKACPLVHFINIDEEDEMCLELESNEGYSDNSSDN